MANIFVADAEVALAITMAESIEVMRDAFLDLGLGNSSLQDRVRIHAPSGSLSMMGGIFGKRNVSGAKVYPTVGGRFDFIINLFSAETGQLIRVVQGNELTRFRTAAVTRVVADACLDGTHRTLAIFGSGIQARAHVEAFCFDGRVSEVLVCAREGGEQFASDIRKLFDVATRTVDAASAASEADIVITATRAGTPLFDGSLLKPGAFVGAIGSSKPTTREIDDVALGRASRIIVESAGQALREAGDLVMAADQSSLKTKVVELGSLIAGKLVAEARPGDITVYKSVGIGIEDVALAERVHRNIPY